MVEVYTPKAKGIKVTLGDVVRLSTERSRDPLADGFERFIGLEHIDSGDLRIRRWGETSNGTTFTNVFRPGQVLFGKRRAYQGKVGVPDFSGVCSGDIYVMEADRSRLLPELLPYICQSTAFLSHAIETSAGSLSPRTNWGSLAAFEFGLPTLKEQWRLVNVLHASTTAAHRFLDAKAAISMVADAVLAEAFVGAPRKTLGSFSMAITKGTTPTTIGHTYVEDGIPFVRAEDVLDSTVDLTTCSKKISLEAHQVLGRSQLQANDVLVTIAGTVGRVGIVAGEGRAGNCNQAVAIVRVENPVLAGYLFYWLMSRDARGQMFGRQVTGTISNLSLTSIRNLQVPILEPSKQEMLVGYMAALRDSSSQFGVRIASLKAMQSEALEPWLTGALSE